MVDIETHKIVDIIYSRKDKDVRNWLKTFPNLELVSRDGAICYKSAIDGTNNDIVQVSDRFHLLKNLSSYCKDFLIRKFPSFVYLNFNKSELVEIELKHKYKLFKELNHIGKDKSSICKQLIISDIEYDEFYSSLKQDKNVIPVTNEEANKASRYNIKMDIVLRARALGNENYNLSQIGRILNIDRRSVKKYLDPQFRIVQTRNRRNSFEKYADEIAQSLNKDIQIIRIYKSIQSKGFYGSYSSLRSYCSKYKKQHLIFPIEGKKERFKINHVIKMLYHPIEELKTITENKFKEIFKEHPIIEKIYQVIRTFKDIVFTTKSEIEFSDWIEKTRTLNIKELNTFIHGIERDKEAVICSIKRKYSNGLAEGTVNKIKFIKRIMYGRCNFDTLRNKILLGEKFN